MSFKPWYLLVLFLIVMSLACSVTINLPTVESTPGPTRVEDIDIAKPDTELAVVTLSFGAGKLSIEPGEHNALISGTAIYNVEDFKPNIKIDGNAVSLSTGSIQVKGVPKLGSNFENNWTLKFGAMPMRLAINAGAYEGNFEFGGLALDTLEVADGAADVSMRFSQPNPIQMDILRYVTGASNVKLFKLANANFRSMIFRSGAGDYTLDFSGELKNDAVVTVESGISRVTLIVPEGVSARVVFKGGLANVNTSGGWKKSGDHYQLEGSGPQLTITVEMGAGSLELRTSP
jgi:hypothetical protein